jgi:hypothetical protein
MKFWNCIYHEFEEVYDEELFEDYHYYYCSKGHSGCPEYCEKCKDFREEK